jgi:hypothetical protein
MLVGVEVDAAFEQRCLGNAGQRAANASRSRESGMMPQVSESP